MAYSRIGSTRVRVVAAVVVVAATLVTVGHPVSASDGLVTFPDVHGLDDANAQSDLVSTAVDYGHLDDLDPKLHVQWNWDETRYSGNNSGDACALFDTTGDGLANYAVCVSIGGNPAAQLVDSPRLYECTAGNLSNNRCNGDTEVTGFTTTCTVAIVGTDTVASCEIDMDDVGGSDATLLNTCSFNSSEPNSNPPDCVFEPGMGIEVVKDVTDDASIASTFDVVIEGVGTVTRTIIGDGTLFVPAGNGTHSVTEISTGDGYALASSSCTTGTPTAISLTVGGAQSSTCTFVNQPGSPSSTTVKTFSPTSVAAGTAGHSFTIAVTNDGSIDLTDVSITDTVDPTLQVTGAGSDLGGDCTASSGNSIDCTVSTIAVGQTATVTVAYSVASTVEPTTVTNTASVTSTELPTPQTASDSLTVTEDVDLAVTKAFTTTPAAGTTGNTFTIVVANSGTSDAENVAVSDVVDTDLTVTGVAIAPVGDCSASSGQLVDCTITDLAAGQSAVVTVVYDVDESLEPTTIANTATAQSDEAGPTTDTTSVTVIEDADLSMVKTFGSDPVSAGAVNRSFALAVTNTGTSDAENIVIIDTVDPTLIVDSVTSDLADCSASAGQSVDCAVAGLTSGQTVTVTVTYHVDTSTESATVSNTASATSDEDTATATTTVDVVEDVVLDLIKSFDSAAAVAGSTGHSFSLEVTNTGISDADNIVITDTVDSRLTVTAVSSPSWDCSASSGQSVTCSAATLAAGATATVTVVYEVDSTTEPATVANTASAASDEDTTTATDAVDITEDVVLSAAKSFSPATVPTGSSGNTFTITVTNAGSSDADNVSVTDTVDATLQVTAVSADLGDCSASSGQIVDCTIPSLDGGQSATVTVTYSIDSGATGTVTNTATVTSDEASTTATSSVDVVADVGFQITKSFAETTVEAGSTGHSFTIGITNSGPSDATGVAISDSVAPDLVVASVSSATADCSASVGQFINCSLPLLVAGQTATVAVTYDVSDSTDAGTISNTATVDSNESSPTTATDSVDVIEDVVLSATKTFAADTVAAGSTGESFTIVVTNTGSSDADNIVITDTVNTNLQVTSVSSATASCNTAQSFTCTTAALGGGESFTVLVTYDVDLSAPATTVTNTANVISDEGTTSASDSVDIVEDVVLELDKFFDDATVAAGVAGRTFSLTATNTGSSDAENIVITDTVAGPLVVTGIDPDASLDCSASLGNSIDCSTAVLAPGDSVTVTVSYDVDPSADPATVSNTATLASDEATTTGSDSIDVIEDVDLGVTKAFGSLTNTAGGTGYSFTIAVSNAGLSDAENVSLIDVVDPALTVTGVAITTGDCSASSGNTIDCSIPVLDGGASTTVTVTYDVDADVATSTVANTATATSDEATASATTSVEIDEQVTLSATKVFDANQVVAGQSSTFTISVTNTGMSTADNLTIIDSVDAALNLTGVTTTAGDCAASTAMVVDCTVATVAPGQTVTVTATFDVDGDTDPATVANTASIASDEVIAITASDTVDITEDVHLSITKTFTTGQTAVGSSGNTFTIVVANTGASSADNVEITDGVDTALTVVGVSVTTGDCSGTVGNNVDCEIDSLAGGTTATITVTYDVEPWVTGGVVSNVASVLSDEVGPITAVDSVELVEDVRLAVTKTFTASPVTAGSMGNTFTIEVTNDGQSTADQVAVTDTVAAVLTVDSVRVSPDGDCSTSVGNDVDCVIDSIRPGQSILITVTYDVPSTANTSTVSNTAAVNSIEAPTPITDTTTVDVVEDVALSVTKAFTAGPVIAGTGGHRFTISVTNTGQSSADSVNLTDSVDTALTISSISSATADCSASVGSDIDCTVASLAPGATATVDVVYGVDTSVPAGTVTNTAAATSAEVTTPVTASDTVTIVEDVDLSVNKTFGTTTAIAGVAGYTFSLSATNNGLSDAENVSITDTVDADLAVLAVTATVGGDCSSSSGQVVDCTFATVAAGDTATVIVAYEVLSGASTPRTVANTGQITSDEVGPVVAGDSVDLEAVVVFDFEKVFAGSTVAAGSTGRSFTITAYNSGPSDASGIAISDTVDPRLTVTAIDSTTADCSASSGQTVDCSLAFLPVGQAAVVTVYYDVDDSVEPATVVNQAEVSSTVPASSVTRSASVDVVEDVDLVAAKAFGPATVAAGSTANTFTIAVTNNGLSEADNVSIVDAVDVALAVTAVSAPSGDCSASVGNTVDCTFTTLGPGETATVTVTYDVAESLDPTTVTNTADVTSDEVSTPIQPSDTVTIIEDANLVIDKVFVDNPVTAGSDANTFTIAVTNTGLSDAENVAIIDTVDPALIITLVTIDTGDCSASSGQVVDCDLPTLAAGATVTVTVTYTVDGSVPASTVTNTATASSDEQAPITDTATVGVVEDVDLSVTKVFSPNPATAGTAGNSFTIVVTNNGTSNADNVVVNDTVDADLQVGSVLISPAGSCAAPSQTISCTAPSVAGGGGALTVTVGYTLDADLPAGSMTNTASTISDEMTAPVYGTADLQVDRDVELNATKTFVTDPVVAGATGYNVAITVTNSGVSTSDPIAVTDIVDTEFTVTNVSTTTGDCSASAGNTVDCTLDPLAPGSSGTVTVTYDVDPAATGTVANTATVDSTTLVSPLDATDTVTIVEDVSLTLNKTFGTATATAGVTGYTFTLAVTNSGLSQADNLSVTDIVDSALTVIGVTTPDGDCSASAGNNIDCTVPSLGPGATTTVTVTYDVDAAATGTVTNTATVTSDEDTAVGWDTIDVVTDSTLTAGKAFASPMVIAGSSSSFSITVANTGPSDAAAVTVVDTVDPRLAVTGVAASIGDCSASMGNDIDCTIPTLASGQAAVITVDYEVASSVNPDTVANTATVTHGITLLTPGDSVDIIEDVDLSATKTFLGSGTAGTTGNSFTIAVTNVGASDGDNLVITDTVDPRLAVSAVSVAPTGTCQPPSSNLRCDVAALAAGSTTTVTVVFDLADDSTGTVTNSAQVTADGVAPFNATDTLTVASATDLSVTKTASAAVAGDAVTFIVTVANAGPSRADAVTVTESMPPELTNPVFNPSTGSYDPTTGQWTGLALVAGDEAVLTVSALIPADHDEPLVNQVSVAPVGAVDPDLDDNDASAQTLTTRLADLELTKTLDTENPVAGTPVQYTMVVTNNGPGAALHAPVVDEVGRLMSDATWTCEATGSSLASCSLPVGDGDVEVDVNLMPGDTATIVVTGTLLPTLEGELVNSASVDGAAESDFSDNTSSVAAPVAQQADLQLAKAARVEVDGSGAGQAFSVGDTITYDLTVVNDGPSQAPDAVVTDNLPDGVEFVAATAERGRCVEADLVVTCSVGDISVGESIVVSVQLRPTRAAAGSQLVNNASAVSDATDVEESGNTALAEVPVAGGSPLAFTGADTMRLLVVGLVLIAAGGTVVWSSRRMFTVGRRVD